MADLTVKRHDTWPPVKATLEEGEGVNRKPINLSGALKVTMWLKSTTGTVIEAVATVIGATEGKIEYAWQAGDTATSGEYKVEFEIEWSAAHIQTVPNASYNSILIVDDLPNA